MIYPRVSRMNQQVLFETFCTIPLMFENPKELKSTYLPGLSASISWETILSFLAISQRVSTSTCLTIAGFPCQNRYLSVPGIAKTLSLFLSSDFIRTIELSKGTFILFFRSLQILVSIRVGQNASTSIPRLFI